MMHRILCCSDTHGEVPPPLNEAGATAWLHGGDIVDGPQIVDDGSSPFDDPLRALTANWFRSRSVPVFAVRGNHDTVDDLHAFRHCTEVTRRLVCIAPRLWLAGIGWHGHWFCELPTENDLGAVCEKVYDSARQKLDAEDRLILLSHYPPRLPGMRTLERDVRDGGTWYDCVRELAGALHPVALVQGHIHRWSGTSQSVAFGGRETIIFHPGSLGGELLVDIDRGTADVRWPDYAGDPRRPYDEGSPT